MADQTVREERPKRSDSVSAKEQRLKRSDSESIREQTPKTSDADGAGESRSAKADAAVGNKTKRSDSETSQNSKARRSDSDVHDYKAQRSGSDLGQDVKVKRSDSDVAQERRSWKYDFETFREFKPRKPGSKGFVNLFTHSPNDFPGAWPEEDISVLLDAWEQTVEEPRPRYEPLKVAQSVLDIMREKGFLRELTRDQVLKQMGQLENEYRTHIGLILGNVETVEGACVPQMERIMKKIDGMIKKKKRTSTGSNKTASDADKVAAQDGQQPDEQNSRRNRRARFQQNQNLQRSVRAMIVSQKTLVDNFQLLFQKLDDSYGQIIHLLEDMVALQRIRQQST